MTTKNSDKHIINLGAGVQSSAMALMAAHGEITPLPDCAIFADTQAESTKLYDWLDWLEGELPFPVYRVSEGNLTKDSLRPKKRAKDSLFGKFGDDYMRRLIPLFGIMPDGAKTAAIGRKCTADYKIKPIMKKVRELVNPRRGCNETLVTQWIGISKDEIQRVKESSVRWSVHRWPLIEMDMHRYHCKIWMAKNGYPEPPRSACYYCPFHSDEEWRNLRDNDPAFFAKAIKFDKDIRQSFKDNDPAMQMEVYLHNSCEPLDEVDFDNDVDKGQQTWDFKAECEGMCGT